MLLKTRDAGASRVAAKKRLRARRVSHQKPAPSAMRWRLGAAPLLALIAAGGLVMVALGNNGARESTGGAQPLFWAGLVAIYAPISFRLLSASASRAERIALVGAARRLPVRRQGPRRPDRVRPLRRAGDVARHQRGPADGPPALGQPADREHGRLPGPRGHDGVRGTARRPQHLPRGRGRARARPVHVSWSSCSCSSSGPPDPPGRRHRRGGLCVQSQLPLLRRPVRVRVVGADARRHAASRRPFTGPSRSPIDRAPWRG